MNIPCISGISVQTMNLLLIKKIEELTLYLIEQNERLDKLEAENELLRRQHQSTKHK